MKLQEVVNSIAGLVVGAILIVVTLGVLSWLFSADGTEENSEDSHDPEDFYNIVSVTE